MYYSVDVPNAFATVLHASDGSLWISSWPVTRISKGKWSLGASNPRVVAVDEFKRKIEKSFPNVDNTVTAARCANGDVVGTVNDSILRFDGKSSGKISKFDGLGTLIPVPSTRMRREPSGSQLPGRG